jgi:hypothetical protein
MRFADATNRQLGGSIVVDAGRFYWAPAAEKLRARVGVRSHEIKGH